MIRLNCTNCKAQLSIDDAFAGGVCRCQYCGTIQTVPKHLKSPLDSSGNVALNAAAKPSAKRARTDPGLSSGLDALASAVAGSGLASAAGRAQPPSSTQRTATAARAPVESEPSGSLPAAAPIATPPPRAGLPVALLVIALVILLLLGIIVGLLLKNHAGG